MVSPNAQLRALREATPSRLAPGDHMSRSEVAQAVNRYLWETTGKRYELDGHAIARYERGTVLWPSAHYRAALRAILNADSDSELGFRPTPRGTTALVPSQVPRTSNPADYCPDFDTAAPDLTAFPPRRIGWVDVEHVRASTNAVVLSDNVFGGAPSHQIAADRLAWATGLLAATAQGEVRRCAYEAVGELSGAVAFSAFDVADHAAADRYFHVALWCADQCGSWALRANTLADMARKSAHLGELDDALSLIEFAQVRSDRVSATARAMMAGLRARLLAVMGRHAEGQAEVKRADDNFADREPRSDPPWLDYYDEADHDGSVGRALIPVAIDAKRPDIAAPRLQAAIRRHGSAYVRSRTFSMTRLAALHMAVGDPHEAAEIGRRAVTDAATIKSHRLVAELRGLARAAKPHAGLPDVATLRHAIDATAGHGQLA
jgi:hypothetical protein